MSKKKLKRFDKKEKKKYKILIKINLGIIDSFIAITILVKIILLVKYMSKYN